MVAKITAPSSVKRALIYNEQKLRQGQAECLYAGNFLKEASELSFSEKLDRFIYQNALNEKVKRNTLHISLNFASRDDLNRRKLIEIASQYMEKIGFGQQPYLVYQHHDAGHQHLHLVTTTIQENGRQIRTHNLGKNQSEKARHELEISYRLTRAEERKHEIKLLPKKVLAQKAVYGKMETKSAIEKVLEEVVPHYKYTTLSELNAVLRLYNVMADPGKEGSRTYQHKGLYYRMLDEKGKKVGSPIKASAFYPKSTLKILEENFRKNEGLKQSLERSMKLAIDWEIKMHTHTLSSLEIALKKQGIYTLYNRKQTGEVEGITYVNARDKVVFAGADLGKEYTAIAVTQRMAQRIVDNETQLLNRHSLYQSFTHEKKEAMDLSNNILKEEKLKKAMELVLKPATQADK